MTMKAYECPQCRRHSLVPTGGFLSCGECSYAITATASRSNNDCAASIRITHRSNHINLRLGESENLPPHGNTLTMNWNLPAVVSLFVSQLWYSSQCWAPYCSPTDPNRHHGAVKETRRWMCFSASNCRIHGVTTTTALGAIFVKTYRTAFTIASRRPRHAHDFIQIDSSIIESDTPTSRTARSIPR